MRREFECPKCESKDTAVTYMEYISHWDRDEMCEPFLKCVCRLCQYKWQEKPSDVKSTSKDKTN